MVEGTDGVIMIDSGSSVEQAQTILSEFRKITDKPVSALIYTNGKADHVVEVEYLLMIASTRTTS